MANTYVKIGGVDWPVGTSEHMAYLTIARYYHVPYWLRTAYGVKGIQSGTEVGMMAPNEAMFRAIRMLFPPSLYKLNPWSEEMITGFTGTGDRKWPELVVQASAGASKSQTFGLLGLLYFFTSPKDTTARFVSTDIKNLRQRAFAAVTQYFTHLKSLGFTAAVFSRQTLAIVNADDDDETISSTMQKAGTFAFALKSGTLEDGISKVIGCHWPTPTGGIFLCADEAENVPVAWYAGLSNLYISTTDVRQVSLGNPTCLTGGLADRAEPEHGWGSVTIEDDRWLSRRGALVLHFDGEKSPALQEPDEYPFLINQAGIDRVLQDNHGRKESSGYLVMVRGWMPNAEGADLLIPMSLIKKFKACDPVTWLTRPEYVVAGYDPGFGGDDAVLQIADVGVFSDGRYGIAFREPVILDINPDGETPVQYQMSHQIDLVRQKQPFALARMAEDESGLQRCADVIETEANEYGIIRVAFNALASAQPISVLDDTPGNKKFGNAVTEMWAKMAELIRFDQVRGLPEQAAKEFSMRIILPKRPLRLESKQELKKRLKRSPDTADACSLAVWAAVCHGLLPGATIHHRSYVRPNRRPRNQSADYTPSDFLSPESY